LRLEPVLPLPVGRGEPACPLERVGTALAVVDADEAFSNITQSV
jgi:hypothetical protein